MSCVAASLPPGCQVDHVTNSKLWPMKASCLRRHIASQPWRHDDKKIVKSDELNYLFFINTGNKIRVHVTAQANLNTVAYLEKIHFAFEKQRFAKDVVVKLRYIYIARTKVCQLLRKILISWINSRAAFCKRPRSSMHTRRRECLQWTSTLDQPLYRESYGVPLWRSKKL